MSIQASWLDKKWTIDSYRVMGLHGLSIKKELDIEENEAKDGKNPVNVKGFKPQELSTKHSVAFATGSNPRQEYEAWKARLGKRAGFHLAGKRFGPPVLVLDKVSLDNAIMSNTGIILAAEITLTFSEDTNTAKAPAAAVELFVGDTALPETTPGYNPNGVAAVKSAYDVRPTASAAAAKY